MTARQVVKLFVPPVLVDCYRVLRSRIKKTGPSNNYQAKDGLHLEGDYSSWRAAMADSTGYDAEIILAKTTAALLKIKNGAAVYERDSVLFDEIQYAWPLLAGLMWVAARSGGSLNVLDFGGSLGSTYFQNRAFLAGLREFRWNIVEQARQVETGKCWFEDEHLKFYASVEDCLAETQPQVILLSGVLQYLPEPHAILDELLGLTCDCLIIDRTPFWNGPMDRLCVQHVPAEIYSASYPSWIFPIQRFRSVLNENWEVVAEFDSLDKLAAPVETIWKGMIATRQKEISDHG
ncbi:MAG: methyltransferase, TIGR04325 family [Chloroflexi bacterium]|nr:methyltransferase, TIGR04325 family [Chloroflexota bacterium]